MAADKQSPFLPDLQALLARATTSADGRYHGEAQRTVAAEELKRLEKEGQILARSMRNAIELAYPTRREIAGEWGFDVRQTGRGQGLLPSKREELLRLFDTYIGKEQGRLVAERFTAPLLNEVIRVRDGLQAAVSQRDSGQTKREASVAHNIQLADEMRDVLQTAVVFLLARRFHYKIDPELQKWGLEVKIESKKGKVSQE